MNSFFVVLWVVLEGPRLLRDVLGLESCGDMWKCQEIGQEGRGQAWQEKEKVIETKGVESRGEETRGENKREKERKGEERTRDWMRGAVRGAREEKSKQDGERARESERR